MNEDNGEGFLREQIIGGIAWDFILITIGFLLYKFGVANDYVWFFLGLFFVIINIATLYRSIDFIDKYDNVAIGIIGVAITGVFLLLIVAVLVILIVAIVKGAQQQQD